ncbi:hypothetical protein R3P38DRAFT_2775422 [Favolaschia claudopus]|uniref:Uncharacterized protein n=1 Tax=Favolaschia claudopus TaxID=2862362 RepID=A0AAW0BTR9_9AGAR
MELYASETFPGDIEVKRETKDDTSHDENTGTRGPRLGPGGASTTIEQSRVVAVDRCGSERRSSLTSIVVPLVVMGRMRETLARVTYGAYPKQYMRQWRRKLSFRSSAQKKTRRLVKSYAPRANDSGYSPPSPQSSKYRASPISLRTDMSRCARNELNSSIKSTPKPVDSEGEDRRGTSHASNQKRPRSSVRPRSICSRFGIETQPIFTRRPSPMSIGERAPRTVIPIQYKPGRPSRWALISRLDDEAAKTARVASNPHPSVAALAAREKRDRREGGE